MTGTNTGTFDLFGLPPTGRPVTMTGQEIFRVRDGKLAEIWHQEDVPGMLRQLGLEPPPVVAADGQPRRRTCGGWGTTSSDTGGDPHGRVAAAALGEVCYVCLIPGQERYLCSF